MGQASNNCYNCEACAPISQFEQIAADDLASALVTGYLASI